MALRLFHFALQLVETVPQFIFKSVFIALTHQSPQIVLCIIVPFCNIIPVSSILNMSPAQWCKSNTHVGNESNVCLHSSFCILYIVFLSM